MKTKDKENPIPYKTTENDNQELWCAGSIWHCQSDIVNCAIWQYFNC